MYYMQQQLRISSSRYWTCTRLSSCSASVHHDMTGHRRAQHMDKSTRPSSTLLGGANLYKHWALSLPEAKSAATDREACRALRPVDGRAREASIPAVIHISHWWSQISDNLVTSTLKLHYVRCQQAWYVRATTKTPLLQLDAVLLKTAKSKVLGCALFLTSHRWQIYLRTVGEVKFR